MRGRSGGGEVVVVGGSFYMFGFPVEMCMLRMREEE